jgi:methylated-DNA-[protein]-cysteine S-methyltransferase
MTVPDDLDRRFRDAAVRAGLLDAAYDVLDSPVGPLLVAASPRGIIRISFERRFAMEGTLEQVVSAAGPRVLRAPSAVELVRRELDEYFAGKRQVFDLSLDLRGTTPFTAEVLRQLARVPYGRTATYAELAARVGRPKAARAVGTVMHRNPIPIVLPCHRVVGSDGSLTGYAGGLDVKEQLLRLEGALL